MFDVPDLTFKASVLYTNFKMTILNAVFYFVSRKALAFLLKNVIFLLFVVLSQFFVKFRDFNFTEDQLPQNPLLDEYEYIIVGGGPGGCLLANRLSQHAKVLLVHGPGGLPNIYSRVPALQMLYLSDESFDHMYQTEPQTRISPLTNGKAFINSGKVLGGSAVLSAQIYSLGREADYEIWKNEFGASYFGYETIKTNTRELTSNKLRTDSGPYGAKGEISVKRFEPTRNSLRVDNLWKDGLDKVGLKDGDYNEVTLGHGRINYMAEEDSGYVSTPVRAFIEGQRKNRNLTMLLRTMVEKIVINKSSEKPVATGVVFKFDGNRRTINASRKVILSAGAIKTPQLLILSGVGPEDHLKDHHIDVMVNLPGVGENLHDHPQYLTSVFFPDGLGYNLLEVMNFIEFFGYAKSLLSSVLGSSRVSFHRADNETISTCVNETNPLTCRPDFEILLSLIGPDSISSKILQAFGYPDNVIEKYFLRANGGSSLNPTPSVTLTGVLLQPSERGSVTLRTQDINDQPNITLDYMKNDRDMALAVELYFLLRNLSKVAFGHMRHELLDVRSEGCTGDVESVEYAECAMGKTMHTLWHPSGTARIGKDGDPMAVVDSKLNVRGVDNLSIVDASVFPTPLSGHMIATITAIALEFYKWEHEKLNK